MDARANSQDFFAESQRIAAAWTMARQLNRWKQSVGAEEGTRTPTPLRVHGPEPCASANSATSAMRCAGELPGHNDRETAPLFIGSGVAVKPIARIAKIAEIAKTV